MATAFPLAIPLPPIYCMKCYVRGIESKGGTGPTVTTDCKSKIIMMILNDSLNWWIILEEGWLNIDTPVAQ